MDELIQLIINSSDVWTEDDRERLEQLGEEKLLNMSVEYEEFGKYKNVANAAKDGFTDPSGNKHAFSVDENSFVTELVENTDTKTGRDDDSVKSTGEGDGEEVTTNKTDEPKTKPTAEEWLDQVPEEYREVIANAKKRADGDKEALVKRLVVHVPDEHKELISNELMQKSVEELQDRAKLLPPLPAGALPVSTEMANPLNYAGANPLANPLAANNNFDQDDTMEEVFLDFSSEVG